MIRNLLFIVIIFFVGCSEKQYFKPAVVDGKYKIDDSLPSPIVQSNKNGAVLKDGTLLTDNGIYNIGLKSDYLFLNQVGGYILVANYTNNNLYFLNTDGNILKTFKFDYMPISASFRDHYLAVVLSNNSSIIWDTDTNEQLFVDKSSAVYAINSKNASPLFLDSSVIFPTLDGKIIIVSLDNYRITKTITLSLGSYFGNIIYLTTFGVSNNKQMPNLIIATNKKLVSLYNGTEYTYQADINDIVYKDNDIYIITLEGEVIELSLDAIPLHKRKFPFANLNSIVVGDSIYTLESQGYLIKINKKDFSDSVYKIGIGEYKQNFYVGDTIYYDDNIIKVK